MATERHRGQRKAQRRVSSLIVLFCSSFLPNPFFGGAAHGQFIAPDVSSARSFSGQFIIHDQRSSAAHPRTVNLETNRNFVRLEPALLTVSCERLKQVLWRELGATAPWRGKIYLVLYSADTADETITITSTQFKDGWQYRVDAPDLVERARFVRVLTQLLLLEMANRNATSHSADVPQWLVEGCAQQLLASNDIEIVLPAPRATVSGLNFTSTLVSAWKDDPLKRVHVQLTGKSPLTFEELSWPREEGLAGAEGDLYRSSAQLFLTELVRLNDGRACLRAMLAELPKNYNWQFAFLRAFRAHFERPLDVEKWWALHLVEFTGRDPSRTWPLRESLERLEQVLRFPVQVQLRPLELPLHTEVTLQAIIRQWDQVRQTEPLTSKLRDLELLRLRVAAEVAGLVEAYHQTLDNYLQQRHRTGLVLPFTKKAALRRLIDQTLAQLDALDAQRQALRPPPAPVAAAPAQTTSRQP